MVATIPSKQRRFYIKGYMADREVTTIPSKRVLYKARSSLFNIYVFTIPTNHVTEDTGDEKYLLMQRQQTRLVDISHVVEVFLKTFVC